MVNPGRGGWARVAACLLLVFFASSATAQQSGAAGDTRPAQREVHVVAEPPPAKTRKRKPRGTRKPSPEAESMRRGRIWGLIATGVGAAAAVPGVFLLTNGIAAKRNDKVTDGVHTTTYQEAMTANRRFLLGTVLTVTGGALLCTGAIVYAYSMPEPARVRSQAEAAVRIVPAPNGLTLVGRF